jgi:protein involved in polysaccharide export with SLBB domain
MRIDKVLFLFFLSSVMSLYSQKLPTGMSPAQAKILAQSASSNQLLGYVQQAKAAGYSLSQVKNLLRAQGASSSDISRLDQLWNDSRNGADELKSVSNEPIRSNFGVNTVANQTEIQTETFNELFEPNKRFGSDFFKRSSLIKSKDENLIEEAPELYIATPMDYQLGPGDELQIELYGASEISYTVQISREGTIKLDRMEPIYLSGLTIDSAKKQLIDQLSQIYQGLMSVNNDPSKVFLDLNLKRARSVVVNITGQVNNPGTFTISAFTSVINALYAAGGPNEVGTFRAVRLVRGGRVVKEIDLYEFFVGGKLPSIYLQDQDILQVPTFDSQIELKGAFKTQAIFEIKRGETLSDVLRYSGGFVSEGYKERVNLNRIVEFKRKSISINVAEASLHLLKDGDIIEANYINEWLENAVLLEGAVYIPGVYSIESVSTIKELIASARGLTPEALKAKAILFRSIDGVETISKSINLLDEESLNLALKEGDRLYIPKASQLFDTGIIRIEGEVNNPGIFDFKQGMSLSDVLILANGFTANANKKEINIYQNFLESGQTITKTERIAVNDDLSTENQVELFENSLIVVRRNPNFRVVEEVELIGLVLNEGNYAIKGNNYRLYDLIQDSGGFLKDAYIKGISVQRKLSGDRIADNEIVKASLLEALEGSADKAASKTDIEEQKNRVATEIQSESVIIGIDGQRLMETNGNDLRENIILQSGDKIYVPKLDNTITVIGEIQKRSKLAYDSGMSLKQVLRLSGGYNQSAKRSKVYVIYKNGTIKSRRRILGLFTTDPRLEPGSTIVVPERLVREGTGPSLGEVVGLTSSLATLVLLIQQLGL